jgi:hypothetical protein
MVETWTRGFPPDEGDYWFYGYIFGKPDKREKPRLEKLEVRRISNGLIYLLSGACSLEPRDMLGFWQKMIVPDTQGLADLLPRPPEDKK